MQSGIRNWPSHMRMVLTNLPIFQEAWEILCLRHAYDERFFIQLVFVRREYPVY